jgi:hypothetical protein
LRQKSNLQAPTVTSPDRKGGGKNKDFIRCFTLLTQAHSLNKLMSINSFAQNSFGHKVVNPALDGPKPQFCALIFDFCILELTTGQFE